MSSDSLKPYGPKNLIPLSSGGLWEAEITTPDPASSAGVRNAMAGVGSTPTQVDVAAGAGDALDQRGLQRLARGARVPPDHEQG